MNLLSISPNFVTADELAQLALDAADGGSVLDGVVVVNPDPTDNTSGLIADLTRSACCPLHVVTDGGDDELVRFGGTDEQRKRLAGTPFEPGALMDTTMPDEEPAWAR